MKINNIAKVLIIPMMAESRFGIRKIQKKRSLLVERDLEEVIECIQHPIQIPSAKLCDGKSDCPDQSDEFACGKFEIKV